MAEGHRQWLAEMHATGKPFPGRPKPGADWFTPKRVAMLQRRFPNGKRWKARAALIDALPAQLAVAPGAGAGLLLWARPNHDAKELLPKPDYERPDLNNFEELKHRRNPDWSRPHSSTKHRASLPRELAWFTPARLERLDRLAPSPKAKWRKRLATLQEDAAIIDDLRPITPAEEHAFETMMARLPPPMPMPDPFVERMKAETAAARVDLLEAHNATRRFNAKRGWNVPVAR